MQHEEKANVELSEARSPPQIRPPFSSSSEMCPLSLLTRRNDTVVKHFFKSSLVLVKDLQRVLQDRVDRLDLPACVGDGGAWVCSHECRAEDDGQVMRVHAVVVTVVHDTPEVKGEGAESGVVGVREAIDDGVEGVTSNSVIVMF